MELTDADKLVFQQLSPKGKKRLKVLIQGAQMQSALSRQILADTSLSGDDIRSLIAETRIALNDMVRDIDG